MATILSAGGTGEGTTGSRPGDGGGLVSDGAGLCSVAVTVAITAGVSTCRAGEAAVGVIAKGRLGFLKKMKSNPHTPRIRKITTKRTTAICNSLSPEDPDDGGRLITLLPRITMLLLTSFPIFIYVA